MPLKTGGFSKHKAIFLTALSGITTGIGAFFGAIIGNISKTLIGISLSFAAGAMLYIISCEILPESKKLYSGRFSSMGNIFRNHNWNNNKVNLISNKLLSISISKS